MIKGDRFCILTLSLLTLGTLGLEAKEIDFEGQIAPILKKNCLKCHGPDKEKSAFRVDKRAVMLKGGDSGLPSIVAGNPEKSFLVEVIKDEDSDLSMPPKGDRLDSEQVALIERWIKEGAHWPGQMEAVEETRSDHWSFQSVFKPDVPGEAKNPIDGFVLEKLKGLELKPNEPADARSLIRRVSVILTGLPPEMERVEAFEKSYAKNSDNAYEKLVDELLASPHFGERWAQHWLDVIRWAETNGSESNLYRINAWRYRDYVVRAFNDDLPYDQFLKEQLAGDQIEAGEATGFLVAGPHVPAATVGEQPSAIRQARADRMDEIMQTIGASMMGMTVSCARCHNHKFDPITIQDYYALTAVFQGVEFGGRKPEYPAGHQRAQRENELESLIKKERGILGREGMTWQESWGGYQEYHFPPVETRALRVEFQNRSVFIDELEVFGPGSPKNYALATAGAKLKTDPEMTLDRGALNKANDGYYGTMMWKSKSPKGSSDKPWVEIHFPKKQQVNIFRSSGNREYYFEVDYLDKKGGAGHLPQFKISMLTDDGTWKQLGHSQHSKKWINQNPQSKNAHQRLHQYIATLQKEGPEHSFIGRFIDPVTTKVLYRGSPENPRDEVMPAGFGFLDGDLGLDSAAPDGERRLEFADWLTKAENPLTSRVMVNRIWHHVFGAGIVRTTSDFGLAGVEPTHPELLDWLASEFVGKKWSMKSMIRLLVTSEAFKRSSAPNSLALEKDAGALFLWRYPPRRVEAEVIRDGVLQASGKLNPELGGPSFRIHNVKKTYAQWEVVDNYGPQTWRRMLYQERMRRVDDRMFTAFDFPDCGQVRAKRPVSTTPLQALNLMNSQFVVDQAKFIAERAQSDLKGDRESQVRRVFELILSRGPEEDELEACREMELQLICRSLINSNEFAFIP